MFVNKKRDCDCFKFVSVPFLIKKGMEINIRTWNLPFSLNMIVPKSRLPDLRNFFGLMFAWTAGNSYECHHCSALLRLSEQLFWIGHVYFGHVYLWLRSQMLWQIVFFLFLVRLQIEIRSR